MSMETPEMRDSSSTMRRGSRFQKTLLSSGLLSKSKYAMLS